MAYHLENTQLRVLRKYAKESRNRNALAKTRLILLQHVLPTTEDWIGHLIEGGAEVFSVLAKPYSIDERVLGRLGLTGLTIIRKSYDDLETTDFLDQHLIEAEELSQRDGKQIVILEVGGYFAQPLSRQKEGTTPHLLGAVEDTTFGHNRYLALANKIRIPVFSVARSPLKQIEARFVGRDAVAAVDLLLRAIGVSISGRNALVIGYGMVGTNVARTLQSYDLNVHVYDIKDHCNLRGFIDGFHIHKKRKLLESADIIFLATGSQALSFEEIEECKNNVILVSVGSKNTEFDITSIKEQAIRSTHLGPEIVKYTLPNSKHVMVVKDGTAVNFSFPSLPSEVIDLVFTEITLCLMLLLKRRNQYTPGVVHMVPEKYLSEISKDWLRFVNA